MNLFIEKRNLTVFILLTMYSTGIFAQSKSDSVKLLREIIVTEDTKKSQDRSTSPLQVLDKEKLATLNSLQISDAIKHFSGVTVKDYGGIGGLKTVSVRSLGANHTAVAYDGITISDVLTGQIDIGRFSLDNVENVSLNIGQNDNIFQPARLFASASVLNIQTQKPTFENNHSINGKVGVKSGSFGLFNPSLLLNDKINRILSVSLSSEWLSADGKYPYVMNYGVARKDSSSVEIRKNTDVKNLRLEGTLFASFSGKSDGYLKTYYYQSERGLPGAIIFYNDKSFASQRLGDKTFFTQANFNHRFSNQWAVQAYAKYNYGWIHFTDTAWLNQVQKLENIFIQNELYGSLSAIYRPTVHLSISGASDVSMNSMKANVLNFAYPTRYTLLSSLAGKYLSEWITAIGSLLYTQTKENVKSGIPADNQKKVSPFVSISVRPFENSDFRVRAFYKNIFRLPTFNDLYYMRVGERKLKPEDANLLNIGATFSLPTDKWFRIFNFAADAYHNLITNKIVATPAASLFDWKMINYGIVLINGLDLSMNAILAISQKTSVEIGGNYTYQQATDRTDKTSRTYGHQLPYTPSHSGSANAGLVNPWVNISYSVIWAGVRYSSYQNYAENRLAPYSDHSISFYKSFNINKTVARAGIELLNIFNKNYEVIRSFPMPGRSFRVNLSINY
ncbi:MAG: TonB-dependent receptor plug domain-containing protein [Paludibacteraceae bacterium]